MSIVLVGVNGSTYLSSDAGLTIPVEELFEQPRHRRDTTPAQSHPISVCRRWIHYADSGDSAIVASTGLNYAGGQSNMVTHMSSSRRRFCAILQQFQQ